MADSVPSLRRLVNELQVKIRELESRPLVVVEKIVHALGPERIVEKVVLKEVVGPERIVEKVVLKEVVGPERIVERVILKEQPATVTERVVYIDNPDHIEMIKTLQGKLCQSISQ